VQHVQERDDKGVKAVKGIARMHKRVRAEQKKD